MSIILGRRQVLKASAAAASVVAGAGFGFKGATAQDATVEPPAESSTSGVEMGPDDNQVTVTHAQGETKVAMLPEVVLSYDIASVDTLQALDVKIAGLPERAAAGDYIDTDGVETIGSLFEPDYEKVNSMQPDLIIVAARSQEAFGDLSKIGPTIDMTFGPGDFLGNLESNTIVLATIFDKVDDASAVMESIRQRADALAETAAGAGTGLVVMASGGSVTALAPGSARAGRGALIYETLGFKPPVADLETATHGEPISFEFLLEHDPDGLFVIDRDQATGAEDGQPAEQVLDNDLMHQTSAWKNDKIVYLNPFDWYIVTGAGLNSAQRMLEELEAVLHG